MKTVLLFSSVFYLLGLKLGNTIDILKKVVTPVKSVISAPAVRQEKPEKAYYFKSKVTAPAKKTEGENNQNVQNKKEDAASGQKP